MDLKEEKRNTTFITTKKKCLVLDLDNTLWGGVVGEEGIGGIRLGFEVPGSYFLSFQQAILDLHNKGVILAINSKNNKQDALNVIKNHPNMILKDRHFAAIRINWNDKVENMCEIAEELNIGLDSMVFLDDDPYNRSLVRNLLPEVEVPELPSNPSQYTSFLMESAYFGQGELTDEDKMRGSMYVTERLRKKTEVQHSSRESFLHGLGLKVSCFLDDTSCLARLAQLTEKTNQFNFNKIPLTEEDILVYINSPKHVVFHLSARDSFGDYGVIGFALIFKDKYIWRLDSLLVSCRALGRGIEEAFLDVILKHAREEEVESIEAVFKESERNQPAKAFLETYFDNMHYSIGANKITPTWIEHI